MTLIQLFLRYRLLPSGRAVLLTSVWLLLPGFGHGAETVKSIADQPFVQEYHTAYPIAGDGPANDVRALLLDRNGQLWAATRAGVYTRASNAWHPADTVTPGPTYVLFQGAMPGVWVGAWDGLYHLVNGAARKVDEIEGPVTVLGESERGLVAWGPDGAWRQSNRSWQKLDGSWSRNVRASAYIPSQGWWVGTGVGLYRTFGDSVHLFYRASELISSEVTALAFGPNEDLWIGSFGGLDVYTNGRRAARYSGRDGLPHYDVRSLTFAPDETLWIGTALGVARFDGEAWSLRHSRRWLLDDDVRDVEFSSDGTAWVATARGVSAIRRRTMTLAEKADYYLRICRQRHVRPPGLVEKCRFPDPTDLTRFEPVDDDNDGQYTAMYLAMESLRYAVTGDAQARGYADAAFDALEFLQTVTGTTGFVARTVVPSTWTSMADPNESVSSEEAVERRARDPRYKVVEQRWRPSADRRWLWKGDTSSDEITGHLFGYLFYYDLVADQARRERVRQLVRRIMDTLIAGGYVLRDIDGQPTRWGVWSPERLNHDPDWRVERPINSFEILSYLRTVHHITGDERYLQEYHRLIEEHHYAENARRPKAYGLGERTHIDDELLALAGPGLLLHESDPDLHAQFLNGYAWAYRTVADEHNPFFNFVYGIVGGQDFHLEESVAFLRDTPLDLRQWTVDNSQRQDLTLVRRPMLEPLQTDRMLPASERGVMRWDKNPWAAASGDFHDANGQLESCGVFWLLPYWMGRHAGFIGPE